MQIFNVTDLYGLELDATDVADFSACARKNVTSRKQIFFYFLTPTRMGSIVTSDYPRTFISKTYALALMLGTCATISV